MQNKIRLRIGRHLNAREHASLIRSVVAVMKEADIPAATDRLQKPEQRTGSFRKFEAVQMLVGEPASMAAHHVTHVQFCHLVVGHITHREAGFADFPYEDGRLRIALSQTQSDQYLRGPSLRVSIIEFRDAALS